MTIIKKLLLSLLAVILIIEEWLWDILTALGPHLTRLLHLQKFEQWLSAASPAMALLAFIFPMLIVTPINLLGLAFLAHGLVMKALILEVTGKLMGTLLVARVFKLTKRQLLTFRWFRHVYEKISGWLLWAHERVASTGVYRLAKTLKQEVMRIFRVLLQSKCN